MPKLVVLVTIKREKSMLTPLLFTRVVEELRVAVPSVEQPDVEVPGVVEPVLVSW